MKSRLGVDIGGTFTDFVLLGEDGKLSIAKVLSNPGNIAGVIQNGLAKLAEQAGSSPEDLLKTIELIVHGTTIATNAVIQQKLAKTGLIATEGFRDILELREGLKENRYDYTIPPPKPLVSRHLRLGVRERINNKGDVLVELSEADVVQAARVFRDEQVEAVAVCLLWSIRNPAHEIRIGDILSRELPGVPVFLSSVISPQIREYPRFSTTALSAALAPLLNDYLNTLEANVSTVGFDRALRYIQCNGGTTSGSLLKKRPVLALDSGPAAGPAAALFFSKLEGNSNVVTLDMGGTSLDVSLVSDGKIETTQNVDVHRYRVGLPMVNVLTIGAGGGSIAHLDDAMMLNVGPQSAESNPGPACYDLGGTRPTVTDANLVLGFFADRALLGGSIQLSRQRALDVITQEIAKPLSMPPEAAAHSIYTIVNENMANAVRAISSEKGHDIRDFTIVCGGGCSPAHAAAIAESVGIHAVLVPRVSSVLCSFGAAITDVRHDYSTSVSSRLSTCVPSVLQTAYDELQKKALRDLASEGFDLDHTEIISEMDLRYSGEIGEMRLFVGNVLSKPDALHVIAERFHTAHETAYTFADRESDIELMGLSLTAYGKRQNTMTRVRQTEPPVRQSKYWPSSGKRDCWFSQDVGTKTSIYSGAKARTYDVLQGPALVEEETTTILVPPGWRITLTANHSWLMERMH